MRFQPPVCGFATHDTVICICLLRPYSPLTNIQGEGQYMFFLLITKLIRNHLFYNLILAQNTKLSSTIQDVQQTPLGVPFELKYY